MFSDDKGRQWREPVVKFDENGTAMVLQHADGVLTPASKQRGFVEIAHVTTHVFVIPAEPGWEVFGHGEDGSEWSDPVIAWGINDAGFGVPIFPDREAGILMDSDEVKPRPKLRGPGEAKPDTAG